MTFPPRIHALLARDAPVGVVIRRGPAKSVCTILWDRRRDTFQLGQWLRGRIYERRSDLSPDGKYLIYFAMNGKWTGPAKGAWTAISRAPYLKAISLFAKGDCWNGGGFFTAASRYWLNDGYGQTVIRDTSEVHRDPEFSPAGGRGNECLGVYFPRLLRDGWKLIEPERNSGFNPSEGATFPLDSTVFEKSINRGWTLRKLARSGMERRPGRGCYWDEHELVHHRRELRLPMPDWEWAEVDGSRLVWASAGTLNAGTVNAQGFATSKCSRTSLR